MVVKEWDILLKIKSQKDLGFYKVSPRNIGSSMILSDRKALECDKLVIKTSEVGSRKSTYMKAALFLMFLQESWTFTHPNLDGFVQLQLT